jgi:hypothetical protein
MEPEQDPEPHKIDAELDYSKQNVHVINKWQNGFDIYCNSIFVLILSASTFPFDGWCFNFISFTIFFLVQFDKCIFDKFWILWLKK